MDPSEPTCNCRIAGGVRSAALNRCQRHGFDPVEALYTRAHAAERRAAVLAALLGCAGEVFRLMPDATTLHALLSAKSKWVPMSRVLDLLATDPHELMRFVPETKPIIEHALGAAGLTIEDLDVLEEKG